MHNAPNTIMPALVGLLAFVVLFGGAVFLLRWLQKRMGGSFGATLGQGQVRVLTRYPLAWQCILMVVEVAGNQYIITVSRNGGVTVIDKLDEPMPESNRTGGFAHRLRQAINRNEAGV